MEDSMNDIVEILGKETIKPSSPTPSYLQNYKLSWFNQSSSRIYIPLVLFYHKSPGVTDIHQFSDCLKKSLAETLNKYYLFAGTMKESKSEEPDDDGVIQSIECNDQGVIFMDAKLKCTLSTLLENPRAKTLDSLFPDNLQWNDTNEGVLLAVQVTCFDCGGFSMSVCLSHKVADLATNINFLQYWAAISKSGIDHQLPPPDLFKAEYLFPVYYPMPVDAGPDEKKCITRRFVFEASKISALKNSVAGEVKNPSRVEVVTALLYKCAISASIKGNPTILLQTVNLRKRIEPPLPDNTVGSLIWYFQIPTKDIQRNEEKIGLSDLVLQMKDSLTNFCENIAKDLTRKNWIDVVNEDGEKLDELRNTYDPLKEYRSSSWCNFPIYEVDFGGGNPVWVSMPSFLDNNVIILMDNKGGNGIEAYISLDEKEMATFERNEELLTYANPASF